MRGQPLAGEEGRFSIGTQFVPKEVYGALHGMRRQLPRLPRPETWPSSSARRRLGSIAPLPAAVGGVLRQRWGMRRMSVLLQVALWLESRRKFRRPELGCCDNVDTQALSSLLLGLPAQIARFATSESVALQLLRRRLSTLGDRFRRNALRAPLRGWPRAGEEHCLFKRQRVCSKGS